MINLFKALTLIITFVSIVFMIMCISEYVFSGKDTFGLFLKSLIVFLYTCLAIYYIKINE
jgi:hypothetical protein